MKRIIHQTVTSGAGVPAPFVDLILLPLAQPGKVLSTPEISGWSNLIDVCCSAVGGNTRAVARVATAIEVMIAALDVLDDIEDGDASQFVSSVGIPKSLNASTALLFLSQLILSDLPIDGVPSADVSEFITSLSRLGFAATVGQHKDLSTRALSDVSLDESLRISAEKSGSLAACACRLGAHLGTNDAELLSLFENFGRHYGTMLQLSNDLHDAYDNSDKTDLAQQKPTLPLVFFGRAGKGINPENLSPDDIVDSGALHFTWVVLEMERQRCYGIVDEIGRRVQNSNPLRSLLD